MRLNFLTAIPRNAAKASLTVTLRQSFFESSLAQRTLFVKEVKGLSFQKSNELRMVCHIYNKSISPLSDRGAGFDRVLQFPEFTLTWTVLEDFWSSHQKLPMKPPGNKINRTAIGVAGRVIDELMSEAECDRGGDGVAVNRLRWASPIQVYEKALSLNNMISEGHAKERRDRDHG